MSHGMTWAMCCLIDPSLATVGLLFVTIESFPIVEGGLAIGHLALELGSPMVSPHVGEYLAMSDASELADWYSTLQFGNSVVPPHVTCPITYSVEYLTTHYD